MYEPQPYAVGDWVEWRGDQYKIETAPSQSGGRYNIHSVYSELECSVLPESITRKLSPSEVVIRIGCLSGTVMPNGSPYKETDAVFFLVNDDCDESCCIPFAMLDEPTLSLVKELLEKQGEEK